MHHPFVIWIVSPPQYLHSRCFEEVGLGLQGGFKALDMEVPIVTDVPDNTATAIVLGTNLLARLNSKLPEKMILYNMEQIQPGSPWLKPAYIELLQRYPVWDYSQNNITMLQKEWGIAAQHCGIGYASELTRIPPQPKDIDVLFIGSLSDRRRMILESLAAKGVQVSAAFNSYGKERDALIARSKLVLNLHYYEAQLFEIVRVSYLLANRVCVVSETGKDAQLEAPFKDGVAFFAYDELVDSCLQLLADDKKRNALAQKGFECFAAIPQSRMLQTTLASLSG